ELARALERAVRRAGLPFAVSEGFSPHMRIAFGAALPVGVGGANECFDLYLTSYVAPEKASSALAGASVGDLMVHGCAYVGAKAPAASVAFPRSSYEALLSQALKDGPTVPSTVKVWHKDKEKELVVKDYLEGGVSISGNTLAFTLVARPTGSLRPDLFVKALLGEEEGVKVLSIVRTKQEAL
ncbi:MAG: TIGR03936 family radical SAM-associated protein, partial [Eggerthellaceae bacterium]|nr:TIGR03936 family radical SAM-associated protein [Eggerthellaceae bacterium]